MRDEIESRETKPRLNKLGIFISNVGYILYLIRKYSVCDIIHDN